MVCQLQPTVFPILAVIQLDLMDNYAVTTTTMSVAGNLLRRNFFKFVSHMFFSSLFLRGITQWNCSRMIHLDVKQTHKNLFQKKNSDFSHTARRTLHSYIVRSIANRKTSLKFGANCTTRTQSTGTPYRVKCIIRNWSVNQDARIRQIVDGIPIKHSFIPRFPFALAIAAIYIYNQHASNRIAPFMNSLSKISLFCCCI